ncbi:MAG TPA: class I SAM-dependent methyltransferase [Verrucomicrobiae bacterium]|nr:class I SAM-dependent methyltransferase [Verrucomicrobiae bacterium]
MTPEQTAREADFLIDRLQLQPGMSVLDVPCGNGRHAVELARRGIRMTGVDISPGFLAEARNSAPDIEWIQGDMRALPWRGRFDAAYCWGNSFAYFDYPNCRRFLEAIAASLRPGGRFLLESGVVAESILFTLQPERSMKIGDIDFSSRAAYDALDGRLDITYIFARGDTREVKPIVG